MKKVLAALMALAMTLTLCTVAFADTCDAGDSCTTHVAKIGSEHYATLTAAVAAAQDGALVELLTNVTDGSGIIIGEDHKNVTINFRGHTYTVTKDLAGSNENSKNQCFQFLQGSESVKLMNGTIIGNNSGLSFIIQNYTNLTLEDMTLDATKGNNSIHTVVSNNCGEVKVIGNTSITAAPGKVALDVSFWPSAYPAGTSVTVDTTGTITGRIDMGLWGNNGTIEKPSKSILVVKNVVHVGEMTVTNGNAGTYATGLVGEKLTEMIKKNVTVSGGTFSTSVNSAYLADGLKYEVVNDGKYTYHSTIDEAVAAAGDNGCVTDTTVNGGTFTIKYNDGTGREIHIYTSLVTPDVPTMTREGYTFKGWLLNDGTTVYADLSNVEFSGDGATLTAVWEKNASNRYYYTSTTNTKKDDTKGSPKTFDAGVSIYALTAVLSVTGMACVGKKKF